MFRLYKRVTPGEVDALMRESARVLDLGAAATEEELDAVRDWKIDVLNRIAMDPGAFVDEREGDELREMCRREATALRLGLPSTWCDGSCP
ncbi:MAG: hypothetical protein ACRDO2_09445 [Nocardioidaceae bacterium]